MGPRHAHGGTRRELLPQLRGQGIKTTEQRGREESCSCCSRDTAPAKAEDQALEVGYVACACGTTVAGSSKRGHKAALTVRTPSTTHEVSANVCSCPILRAGAWSAMEHTCHRQWGGGRVGSATAQAHLSGTPSSASSACARPAPPSGSSCAPGSS